jgi:hypothetical protein
LLQVIEFSQCIKKLSFGLFSNNFDRRL